MNKDEHGVIEIINDNIKKMNNLSDIEKFIKYINCVLNEDYVLNKTSIDIKFDGAIQVIDNIKKVMEE